MKELIDVFRMLEIDPKVRANLIIKLGKLINDQYGVNITELVVYELVSILDRNNEIIVGESRKHYLQFIEPLTTN